MARPINMLRSETLTSQQTHGYWHARYPTALTTLCGLPTTPPPDVRLAPTCSVCLEAALVFDGVDGSAPVWWRLRESVA